MRTKISVLAAAALAPFAVSLIKPFYVILVYYYAFTYPVTVLYGLAWCGLYGFMYIRAGKGERRALRWCGFLGGFAFVEPAHLILAALGIPPFRPDYIAPL